MIQIYIQINYKIKFFKKYYMNRKSFMDKIPILILIILVIAYYFMNENNGLTQSGGGSKSSIMFGGMGKYSPGTSFLYQMRYLIYFFFVFLIIFNIYYSFQSYKVSTISLQETGSAFLTSFGKMNQGIFRDKLYKGVAPEKKQYDNFVAACGVDYKPWVEQFCKLFAPCSCCGIGDYAPDKPGASQCTPDVIKAST